MWGWSALTRPARNPAPMATVTRRMAKRRRIFMTMTPFLGPIDVRMIAALTPHHKIRPPARTGLPLSYPRFQEGVSMQRTLAFLFLLVTPLAFAATAVPATAPPPVQKAMKSFLPDALAAHDKFLSSDLLEGRGPGTRGDDLAMQYIAAQFQAVGLEPAGENGPLFHRLPPLRI